MPRRNITSMPLPQPRYRPDRAQSQRIGGNKFETARDARLEDQKRCEALVKRSKRAKLAKLKAKAAKLAQKLAYREHGLDPPDSMASSGYMRDQRIRIGGAIWKLTDNHPLGLISTFTVINSNWEFPGKQLSKVDPRKLRNAFRSWLMRCGAGDASGYLVAFIDAEYEPVTDTWRFHFHGLVSGGMRDVVDQLRHTRGYRSKQQQPVDSQVRTPQRVRISAKPLVNIPEPLTYLLKSFWSSRWEGPIDGAMQRQCGKRRIREPRHTQSLLWLDRWSLQDITLLMGVRVGPLGFELTNTKLYTNGGTK